MFNFIAGNKNIFFSLTFKILCKSFRKRFFILAVINVFIILIFFKQKMRTSTPKKKFLSNQCFSLTGLWNRLDWRLVEQKFHFSDGTFFRISTTRFWTKVTNSLLYHLIQAKETFELDQTYKLEISISPLKDYFILY